MSKSKSKNKNYSIEAKQKWEQFLVTSYKTAG